MARPSFSLVSGRRSCFFCNRFNFDKGSDSAPHSVQSKRESKNVAGCFTQGWTAGLVISALEEAIEKGWINEEDVTLEKLEGFLSCYGRDFYKVSEETGSRRPQRSVVLRRRGEKIPEEVESSDGTIKIVPFGRGKEIMSVTWDIDRTDLHNPS